MCFALRVMHIETSLEIYNAICCHNNNSIKENGNDNNNNNNSNTNENYNDDGDNK